MDVFLCKKLSTSNMSCLTHKSYNFCLDRICHLSFSTSVAPCPPLMKLHEKMELSPGLVNPSSAQSKPRPLTALMSAEWQISAQWQRSVLLRHHYTLFCTFFKRCQYKQCLILSSFLLFAAFKKEDSGFDEVGWKQVNFRELVTSLAQFQGYTTVLYAVFFTKITHQGLVGQMLSGLHCSWFFFFGCGSCFNSVHMVCNIFMCGAGWFSLSSQRRPSGSVAITGLLWPAK